MKSDVHVFLKETILLESIYSDKFIWHLKMMFEKIDYSFDLKAGMIGRFLSLVPNITSVDYK